MKPGIVTDPRHSIDGLGFRLRVASDVGGTFTDSLAYDSVTRTVTVAKVPTTPQNRAIGTVEGLKRALALQKRTGAEVDYVGHGMTTATNAVIQRKGGRTAFVTNEGFRDLLSIGRQDRPSLYDLTQVRPDPLAARADSYTVAGRIGADGREITPLDEPGVAAIAAQIRRTDVLAVAICFLHAYANPEHERRAKAILSAALPTVVVCCSTEILSEFREYERASTVVLNAYLMPVMDNYLGSLVALLSDPETGLGLRSDRPVMVMEASGGLMTVDTARAKPVHTVLSGPAGGVVASAHVAALSGIRDIVTMDMGGTSTDISLILDAKPQVTRQASLARIPVRIPVIDINAIGAGGGSIAWIDDGGALRVGPISAEAVPGPACYRRGGTRPTVTDANLVLGRFGEDTKLGGDLTLDKDAAHCAIEVEVARPLGLSVVEAAAGIVRVANANMVRGIRVVSVERGHDPRRLTLVPFGGAGPMHGAAVARELAIPRILVPPTPGILCALGMLVSDLRHDLIETHLGPYADFGFARGQAILAPMAAEARRLLDEDGVPEPRRHVTARVDMRYIGQSYELAVPLDLIDAATWSSLPERFHEIHRQRFGHADTDAPVEIVSFGMTAIGLIDTPQLAQPAKGRGKPTEAARLGSRKVYFESLSGAAAGWLDCPVWQREALLAGNVIQGPAVLEEVSATTVLYPADVARVDAQGSLIVEVGK
ncbi:MAG: hydantoinase/oxoprolinase family protein [Reyranella sp.]|uniref:hydantoinase/oxoprolinase family protein n=1 Tax=Reyranella sp. TaxID=1929291 RepID=UPI003D0EE4A2